MPPPSQRPVDPTHEPPRTIAHADMDAFYASVEQLDRPELRGKPVLVGSDSPRGVVTTASYEARRFGVRSAMPSIEARRRCPDCLFVPVRMKRYSEVAQQIRAVFHEFTPLVEPLSLDEAFLDLTGSLSLFGSGLEIGKQIKARVREVTGLTISVGIGPTMMIAKIASDLNKPDGLLAVEPAEARAFLHPLPVGRLWGVGPAMAARLERLGVATVGQLAAIDPRRLASALGKAGPFLHELANGRDPRRVSPDRERKSYGEERTFERDLRDGPEIRALLQKAAGDVAHRLRADQRRARTVVLKFKLTQRLGAGKYPIVTRRKGLTTPTDDGPTIARQALDLWVESHQGRPVRLVGVSVTDVEDVAAPQLSLFEPPAERKSKAINAALDALEDRFGSGVVRRGGR